MNISNVKNQTPLNRFIYWIRERHKIYERRLEGKPKPWTNDTVLQSYFFTNPYRENDKTTVWFRNTVREPLHNNPDVLMATVIFRWFNRIETGQVLVASDLLRNWNEKQAVRVLRKYQRDGRRPLFTGAFMIKVGNGPPGSKLPQVCSAIQGVYKARKRLLSVSKDNCRLQALWQELKRHRGLGGFMAYEIVCDLRYTYLLKNATDVDTWCNQGPGAVRGLRRLYPEIPRGRISKEVWQEKTIDLLIICRKRLNGMPQFEMREVEHSLCEFDKYERALWSKGKNKRKYNGQS